MLGLPRSPSGLFRTAFAGILGALLPFGLPSAPNGLFRFAFAGFSGIFRYLGFHGRPSFILGFLVRPRIAPVWASMVAQ